MPNEQPNTRFGRLLPELRFSLSLLYMGRFLVGMQESRFDSDETVIAFDAQIEDVTNELVATELLHEAAVLAGDVLPEISSTT